MGGKKGCITLNAGLGGDRSSWSRRCRGDLERHRRPRRRRTFFGLSINFVRKRFEGMVRESLPVDRLEVGEIGTEVSGRIRRSLAHAG